MKKVLLGKIVKLHGIKGEMKVSTSFDKDFDVKNIKVVFDENENEYAVNRVFKVTDGVVFGLENVDLSKAQSFVGKSLYIDRAVVGEKILFEDLKGSEVFVSNKLVGKVVDVQDYGSAEVVYVKKSDGSELIFPCVKGIIESFDEENKKLCLNKTKLKEVSDYED